MSITIPKIHFNTKLNDLCDNKIILDDYTYVKLLNDVKESISHVKRNDSLSSEQKQTLSKYGTSILNGRDILTETTPSNNTTKYYCRMEDMFDILKNHHELLGHQLEAIAYNLNEKYCNITTPILELYASLCKVCIGSTPKNEMKFIPGTKSTFWRCQVEVILINSVTKEGYQFLLIYVDIVSNFLVLKPLKSNSITEVADTLIYIFYQLRAPYVLQCVNGRQNAEALVQQIATLRPIIRMAHGETVGSKETEILEMMSSWMLENNTDDWSKSLRHVQRKMNYIVNSESTDMSSPHNVMFASTARSNMDRTVFTENEFLSIESEEDLIRFTVALKNKKFSNKYKKKNKDVVMEVKSDNIDLSETEIMTNCVACGKGTELGEIGNCVDCNGPFHMSCAALVNEGDEEKSLVCVMCTGEATTTGDVPENLPSTIAKVYPVGTNVLITTTDADNVPTKLPAIVCNYFKYTNTLYQLKLNDGTILSRLYKSEELTSL